MTRRALLAGLAAGTCWALADWAASGLVRVPPVLVGAELVLGLLAGLLAGGIAAGLRRPPIAAALVLALGIAIEGLATVSKELAGAQRPAALAAVALAALTAVALALRARPLAALAALVLLPAGASLGARAEVAGAGGWAHLAGLLLSLAWLAVERAGRARGPVRTLLGGAAVLALVVAQREAPGTSRRTLPPVGADADAGRRPNVVLLVIDTLRADATALDGPLAGLARRGVEFRSCVSAAPWTLPAVGALLTGLYPSEHGAVAAATPLAEDTTTLAEHLRAAGYATAAFTGGAFVGPAHRLDQGFEHFDASAERGFGPLGPHLPLAWRIARNRYAPLRWLVRRADEQRGLAGVLDAALHWVRAEPRGPTHLFLHTYQVHDYYLYDPDTDDAVLRTGPPPSARFARRLSVHPGELRDADAADLAHFRAVYDARVAAVEALLPRLVAELEAALGGETLWIVTSDHGEGFDAELGRVHHGGRLHEDLLHVPLVLFGPGVPVGRVVADPVRAVDVLPTVLDLVGLPTPADVSGESLLPALAGARPFPAPAYAEEREHGLALLAARVGSQKAVRAGAATTEHFDLGADPRERAPRSGAPPPELRDALDAFAERHPARARDEVELDAATRAHLRSLGYVE